MRVAVYARVSTKDKGQDTLNQLRELRQFAEASGWTIAKEYIDCVTASGKKDRERSGYIRLRPQAQNRACGLHQLHGAALSHYRTCR
jgi:DNA invertase Pin-like site-specific DNA recombinase